MPTAFLGLAAAFVVALGCAALANAVLGWRPRSLPDWNEAFLAGLGIATAAVIPLSLLRRPGTAFALLAALLVVMLLRRSDFARALAAAPGAFRTKPPVAAALAVAGLALFAWSNGCAGFGWDGFQIWMTKAQEFYATGELALDVPTPGYMTRIVSYPPAVPLAEALVASFWRAFPFAAVKGIFTVFALSLVVGTFRLVETLTDRRTAYVAAGLASLLPGLTMRTAVLGNADMPLAAVGAAAAAAALRGAGHPPDWRKPAPWLLGTLAMVKSEGTVLLAIGAVAMTLAAAAAHRPTGARRILVFAAPLAFFVLARFAQRTLIPAEYLEFSPITSFRFSLLATRGPIIAARMGRWLLSLPSWGILWPAFLAGVVVVAMRAPRSGALAIAATALCVVLADAGMFLFTRWGDVRLHFDQAYPRLLAQVAPLAVATVAAAVFPLVRDDHGRRGKPAAAPRGRRSGASVRGGTIP